MPFDSTNLDQTKTLKRADVIALLDEMRELLSNPERWHQYNFCNQAGTAFCVAGAALKIATGCPIGTNHLPPIVEGIFETMEELIGTQVAWFNDAPDTTHADILKLIDDTRASFVAVGFDIT